MTSLPKNSLFHVIFTVPDLERSLAFYRDIMGFEVLLDVRHAEVVPGSGNVVSVAVLKGHGNPSGMVELVQRIHPPSKPAKPLDYYDEGFWCVTFEVKDLDAVCGELAAKGVNLDMNPKRFFFADVEFYTAMLRDVDGNRIELVQI